MKESFPQTTLPGLLAFFFLLWAPYAFAFTFSVSGNISSEKTSMTLSVVMDQLESSEFVAGDAIKQQAQLNLYIQGSSRPILASASDTSTDRDDDFYWEQDNILEEESGSRFKLTYSITVYNNPGAVDPQTIASLLEANNNTIKVTPEFKAEGGISAVKSESSFTISQIFSVPNASPENVAVSGVHRGISVTWTGNKTVDYTKDADESQTYQQIPEKALVMLFHNGESELSLKAFTVDNEAGNHQETTCTYTYSAEDSECISCPEGSVFVSSEQEIGGIDFSLVSNRTSAPEKVFSDLAVGEEYKVAVQYQKGTGRSACYSVIPVRTVSLTETNGEEEGIAGDPRCFIVSATYGHSMSGVVDRFRWFRDRFLMPFASGRSLVNFYYDHSQGLSDMIRNHPFLQMIFRLILWPLALILYIMMYLSGHPWLTWSLLLLTGLYTLLRLSPVRKRR